MAKKTDSVNEFNLTLTKEQLGQILRAISPFRSEEYVKLSFVTDNIVVETDDIGVTGKIILGNANITDSMVGISLFLNKSLLNSLNGNITDACTITFKNDGEIWSEATVEIQGDKINVGLPMFEKEINTSWESTGKEESILSEFVDKAITLTGSAIFKDVTTMGSIVLGKEFITGTEVTQAFYKKFFKNLEVYISPIFKPFLHNLTRLGATIHVIDAGDTVVFKTENVEYKTMKLSNKLDVKAILAGYEENLICKFRLSSTNLLNSLNRLSIPLFGADTNLFMKVVGDKLIVEILDIQNRKSKSEIAIVGNDKEDIMAQVSIHQMAQVLSSFVEADITLLGDSDTPDTPVCIKVEDETHTIYLMAQID